MRRYEFSKPPTVRLSDFSVNGKCPEIGRIALPACGLRPRCGGPGHFFGGVSGSLTYVQASLWTLICRHW